MSETRIVEWALLEQPRRRRFLALRNGLWRIRHPLKVLRGEVGYKRVALTNTVPISPTQTPATIDPAELRVEDPEFNHTDSPGPYDWLERRGEEDG